MTHVHYKFSSKLSYDTAVFDGPHITLRDLKKQIMARERLRSGDCDLQITNAQSKEEYTDDEGLIPKGCSVIVRRIPIIGGKSGSSNKTHHKDRSVTQLQHAYEVVKAMDAQASSSTLHFFSKMTNLADADVSEEDKIKVLQNQSAYDTVNYSKKFGTVLPANYTCYRCGNTGHHIRNCPTSGQDKNFEAPLRIKKSSGIPRSFMVEVDDPSVKGAMLTNCGRYAVAAIDAEAYAIGKKEKPPFFQTDKPKSEVEEDPIPDELLCLICHDLLSDAVVIPCCGNSYCDDCIRTTLLDSEEHVCPTCSQSDVSPDTLIANKFLRQAVNTFKKERGQSKTLSVKCDTSQSQNPSPTPSPVRTPPRPPVQSLPQLPQEPTCSQQDSPLHCPEVEDTPPLSGNPPASTGPTSPCNKLSTSLQTEQSCLETPDREAEGETQDDSAAAAATTTPPSVLLSDKDPAAAPSQLMPLVEHTTVAEPPPMVTVELQQSPLGPVPRHPPPSSCWSGAFPPSGCPPGGWSESQQLMPSPCSAYTAPPPPLFPSPLFHTYLSAHQSHTSYPPGYPPPATPIWTLPCPQGAPLPSLCSSTSTIPALVPKEWYRHQRETKERSPHRGPTHRHSSSRSQSKSSKSKSSRSYSSSKSRSRSRSRSQGRSRPRSPYSRHRDLQTRSTPSYSYGYRRSPTPSSSSSPHVGHHSRSKSPSDHRKNRHHSRHHTKKSASSSYGSAPRGERSGREDGGFGASLTSSPYAHHSNQRSGLELETERYLQWKKEYKEWCEKYFNSYVGPFHQLPLPFINLPPPPQWEGSKFPSHANLDSRFRHAARTHGRSPPSQSSSDSRSPPSHSSSDSRSTASQSSSDSRSPPSHTSNNSRSPPSQSSSDSRSTPSEDGAVLKACQQQKVDHLPITFTKGSKEVELQETSKDDKKVIIRDVEDLSPIKYKQRKTQKHGEGRGEESSSPAAADSTDDNRKDERGHDPACKDGTLVRDEATFQSTLKPDKPLDKDCVRSREKGDLEEKKGRRRGKDSDSRQDAERRHRMKSSRGADRADSDRYRHTRDRKAPDLSSEKNRKRKGETPEKKETCKDESPDLIEKKKQNIEQKKESKPWPLKEKDIWEGRITVKPQKKISININLDVKKKEEKTENQESIIGKSEDEMEKTCDGEEKLNRGDTEVEVNEKKKSSREKEEKIKPDDGEPRQLSEKAAIRNDKRGMWVTIAAEEENVGEKKDEDFDSWHCAPRGPEEGKNLMEEGDERRSMTGKDEKEERVRFVQISQKERTEGESTCEEIRGNLPEALMEGVKTRVRKEEGDEMKVTPQRSSNESHHDGPNSIMMDDNSSCEDSQEKWTVVKALEENIQARAVEDQLVLVQVPRSKWEKEESGEEVKAPDPRPVVLPPPLVTPTDRETEGQERQRSVDTKKDRDRQKGKDEEPERSLDRSLAPSSGKDTSDGTWCADRERERGMEMEQWRDRERGRDRQKETKRSKERTREEERGRDRGRERGHSSSASVQKKNLPSSSHFSQHSMSQDTERRGRQQGGDHDHKRSSTSSHPGGKHSGSGSRDRRAVEMPDKHTHKTQRDTSLDPKRKDKNYHGHRESSGSRHQDRAAGTQLSSEFPSLPFPSESSSPKPRMSSPGLKLKQDRSRNESKEAKEWTGNKVERVAEAEGGSLWRDVDQQLSQEIKWEELEEGERPSSSSSASQDGSKDDRRKRKKKRKEQTGETSQAGPEPLEDCELKKHKKKSRRSMDGREEEEEGGGEGEDDHAKRCSAPSS
ncbi:E3 ubiquitin-protein ligase RBBP6 isoform X1 [Hippoglossus hippoglossus]|uniref:E3 ubiquitin-protein ligase RBBP6 isoform X1 n=1 Tax=Hippoglossus hippoglossus TaxID=8267 RepID=UPI00148D8894|nr:E3 ubiquitin-protein ligase RBBP6 isoform X1 [Hippoglossus hippoglossus]